MCYCHGREMTGHLRTHRYRVIDSLKFALFAEDWGAKEEKLLLEGVLKFGFGNWVSIAENLGKSKSPRECELHYRQVYLAAHEVCPISERDLNGFIVQRPSENPPPLLMDTEDSLIQVPRPEPEKHALMEFAGYMPLRRDFEVEYENDIEMYLADLEFYDDDTEEDRAIKFSQLGVYNKVLDEREERKEFVMERWLQELKTEKQFRGNVLERNVYHAMKPYARFSSAEDHKELCQAMVHEYTLRMKLEELNEARRQGVRTEAEFRAFLQGRRNDRQKEYEVMLKNELESGAEESQWVEMTQEVEVREERQIEAEERQLEVEEMQLEAEERQLEAEERQLKPEEIELEAVERLLEVEERQLEPEEMQLEPEEMQLEAEARHLEAEEMQIETDLLTELGVQMELPVEEEKVIETGSHLVPEPDDQTDNQADLQTDTPIQSELRTNEELLDESVSQQPY
jgi:transcriptional adapter 2-alpha